MIDIKSDSRKVKLNDKFIALRGISSDGHDYIEKAIENGASEIIAEHGNYGVKTTIVKDTRDYLNRYLENKYKDIINDMVLIGYTGTNGKTTSAYLLYECLNNLGYKCAYIGTIGYYLDKKVYDLPNTSPDICDLYEMIIEAYEKGYKYISLEVSSQGLSYGRIDTLRFDYAVFTNLTRDHLDFHKTMENYALAKQQLFKKLKINGIGIINIDDSYVNYFKIGNYITYGFNDSDYKISDYNIDYNGVSFKVNNKYLLSAKLIGKYNIYNLLVTYILLDKIGIKYEDIKQQFLKINPPNGRMDIIKYNTNTIIIDYAHTPDAMENIINATKDINYNKLYIVFGCTGDRDRKKRPIMTDIALNAADYVYITSDDLHNESFNQIVDDMLEGISQDNYKIIEDRYSAIKESINKLDKNDLLLILGKGHEDFIIVGNKRIPHNDHKVVSEIMKGKEIVSI